MGWKPRKRKHWKGRPPKDAENVFRLSHVIQDEECWVLDDGKPGIAFSGQRRSAGGYLFPYAWGPTTCGCNFTSLISPCPIDRAMNMTSTRFGAANGAPMHRTRKKSNG